MQDGVVLRVPDCLGASSVEVKKLVALELAPRLQVVEAGGALHGRVVCAAPRVVISVEDAARATPLRIELDLEAAAPQARQRLLALALAELIGTRQLERAESERTASERAERERAERERVESERAKAAANADSDADDDADSDSDFDADSEETTTWSSAPGDARFQLWLAPAVSVAAEPLTPLFGAAAGAARALGPLLFAIDLEARFGGDASARSDVALQAYSAALSAAPLFLRAPVQLSAGLVFRVGYAHLSGSANRPELANDALDGVWLGPAALVALQVPLASSTALRFAVEAGHHLRPIVGRDEVGAERFALRGMWLSLSVGFALNVS